MSSEQATYEQGCQWTYVLVKEWLAKDPEAPRFRFPRDIALLAGLEDVGQQLAINDSARRLVDHLVDAVRTATGQAPTTMMLLVVLEKLGQPIARVPLGELGLRGQLVPVGFPVGKGGSA